MPHLFPLLVQLHAPLQPAPPWGCMSRGPQGQEEEEGPAQDQDQCIPFYPCTLLCHWRPEPVDSQGSAWVLWCSACIRQLQVTPGGRGLQRTGPPRPAGVEASSAIQVVQIEWTVPLHQHQGAAQRLGAQWWVVVVVGDHQRQLRGAPCHWAVSALLPRAVGQT